MVNGNWDKRSLMQDPGDQSQRVMLVSSCKSQTTKRVVCFQLNRGQYNRSKLPRLYLRQIQCRQR